ncbi:hypothetical protein EHS25_003678 [Saitozyma podzolica]|uniref:Uncharacterized protein n=1 Tax=Saitozyma podzolica TaxID=1890683 RepID=A0A427Y393_9TREE|nr:hypothetical protein EHS25_003678 [Saitozyma podzolica]
MASNDTAEIPVPADLSAAALRAVLAAIYSPDLDFGQLRSRLATITIADLFDINAFVKLYDLDKSSNGSVYQIILDEIQKAPHLVFAEASQRDDLAMAKRALSFFANKAKFKRDREDIEDCRYATFAAIQGVTPLYLFELLRLRGSQKYLKTVSVRYGSRERRVEQTNWRLLSSAFDPHRK